MLLLMSTSKEQEGACLGKIFESHQIMKDTAFLVADLFLTVPWFLFFSLYI